MLTASKNGRKIRAMVMKKVAEAVAIAVGIAVVAMVLRSDRFVLRVVVIMAIFVAGFVNDVVPSRKSRR